MTDQHHHQQQQQQPPSADDDHVNNQPTTVLVGRIDDYLLLAASILGLFAVFFYIYILTGEREKFADNDEEGEGINGDGVRTKRLTKEERKALKSSNFSYKKPPPKVRLDTGQLEKRMWYIPAFCRQDEVDDVCRSLHEKQPIHVADLSDQLGITCYQTMAAIKEGEKNGKLSGTLTDEGIYQFMDEDPTNMSHINARKVMS